MSTDNDAIDTKVRAILSAILGISEERARHFNNQTGLFGSLPELDSMAVAGLLAELEDQFGIVVYDDEVDGELLETFGGLTNYVGRKLAA